jgi:hypothetical protein
MYCFCLQDFITMRSVSSVLTVVQSEPSWLDLSGFQDLALWLDVKEFSGGGTISMTYETSPVKDDSTYVSLASVTVATGVNVTLVLKDSASTPITKWLRWKLSVASPGGTWDTTFRIWVAANGRGISPSMAPQASAPMGTPSTMPQGTPFRVGGLGGQGGATQPTGQIAQVQGPQPLHLVPRINIFGSGSRWRPNQR